MNYKFTLHGAPRGQDIWGDVDDKYYNSIYSDLSQYNASKYIILIEIKRSNSYYTFISAQNVQANDGRSGSYFGMTFKLEGKYCKDVYSLHTLFQYVFDNLIKNNILVEKANGLKFLISNFKVVETKLNEISTFFINQINKGFSHDFADIKPFNSNRESIKYYNLVDVNSESFHNDCSQYEKIIIATSFSAKDNIISSLQEKEKVNTETIKVLSEQKSSLLKENEIIPTLKKNITTLNESLSESKAKVDKYNKENNNLQNEVNRITTLLNTDKNKLIREIHSKVSKLEMERNKSVNLTGSQHQQKGPTNNNSAHQIMDNIYYVIIIVNILAAIALILFITWTLLS